MGFWVEDLKLGVQYEQEVSWSDLNKPFLPNMKSGSVYIVYLTGDKLEYFKYLFRQAAARKRLATGWKF